MTKSDTDSLAELIALMHAEDGQPSPDDYAWADAALGITDATRNRY